MTFHSRFFFFYSLSLFLSSLNHEKCFYLQVQTFDHCKKGTFDCYFRWKLSHAYFLACATHHKSVLLFHFFFICSSLTSGLLSGLVLWSFRTFSRFQVCLIVIFCNFSLVIFCTQKQPELTWEVSFSSSSVVHHWRTIEGSCMDVSILTNKLLCDKRVHYECSFGIFCWCILTPYFLNRILHFPSIFSTDLFFTASRRFSQDMVSKMLAIVKIPIESGPASPWSSRLIAAEVLRRSILLL